MMANYHPLVPKDDVAAQSLKTDFSANSSPHLPFQASVLFYLCSMQCYAMFVMNILLCGDCLTSQVHGLANGETLMPPETCD